MIGFDAAAIVDRLEATLDGVVEDFRPNDVAIAFNGGVGGSEFENLFREKGGVDAAVNDSGTEVAGDFPDGVTAEGVPGVYADADDVTFINGGRVELFEGLIADDGVAEDRGGGGGEHVEPAGGNHRGTEGHIAGIDQVDAGSGRDSAGHRGGGGLDLGEVQGLS